MWLPINGEPPPNGGAGAGAGAGGGAFGGPKKSNLSRAVMRARVTKSDSAAAKAVDANKKRVRDEKGKQQKDVAEVRVDIGELKDAIKEAGVSVDNVAAVEKKFNALVNKKLAKEKAKLEVKKRELMKLNQKLKEVQKNQAKIFCGVALWKSLMAVSCLLILGLVASVLVPQF